jgi:hypothetical protein
MNHPEQRQLNSLTSPSDIDKYPDQIEDPSGKPPLTNEQLKEARSDLVVNMTKNYPTLDRYFCDPEIRGQTYAVCSFIPSSGSKPDKDGVYGMMKVRGVYPTIKDAEERSDYIIRNVDSYHKLYIPFVGRPFPITESLKYAEETTEVNLKEKIKDNITNDIKKKSKEEKAIFEELEKRKKEFELLSETSNIEDLDDYITAMVTRANMDSLIDDLTKKIENYNRIKDKSIHYTTEAEKEHPQYRKVYVEKYIDRCTQVGITEENNLLLPYMRKYQ